MGGASAARHHAGHVAKLDRTAPRYKRRLVAIGSAEQAAIANAALLEDLVVAAMNTGMRKNELMSLTWDDVRDGRIVLKAEKTKTRRARTIRIGRSTPSRCERYI